MQLNREMIFSRALLYGYRIFKGSDKSPNYDINAIGVRRNPHAYPDIKFGDLMTFSFLVDGQWQFHAWPITTTSQRRSLLNLVSAKGATNLVAPQQARQVWEIGTFGKDKAWEHEALVQRGNFLTTHDNNKDLKVDFDGPVSVSPPTSGLCMHGPCGDSFGCQEFESMRDHKEAMSFVHKQINAGHGKRVTYTLIDFGAEVF